MPSMFGPLSRVLAKARRDRRGNVLPIMLALMAAGGVLIAPSLDLMRTGLKAGEAVEDRVHGLYAADAGIEHGLWKLQHAPPAAYPYSYQISFNGMPVSITLTQSTVLWGFTIGPTGSHSNTLLLHATLTYDSVHQNYLYTVSITNTNTSNVHLDYIMVTPPSGFSYVQHSATGLTTQEPEVAGDPNGGMGLRWNFDTPRPSVPGAPNPSKGTYSTAYQYFRLQGPVGYTGPSGYLWVGAEREDIGTVSTALALKVASQSSMNGAVMTTEAALVLQDTSTGAIIVGSWQVN